MHRWIGLLLCACILLSGCKTDEAASMPGRSGMPSGTFSGSGTGKSGAITTDVLLDEGVIIHIELLSHSETPGYDRAMIQLMDDIISGNTTDVDAVTGATMTSLGFLEAVDDALANAKMNGALLAEAKKARAIELSEPELIQCDLLIVGGGGAGFTAAIEALSLGTENVIILEKMTFGGGNTRMSGGEYAAPGNWIQESNGIERDSPELFFEDIYEGGHKQGDETLIRVIAENALENAYWLRDYVGVQFRNEQSWYGGHSVVRTLWPIGDGPKYVETLIKKADELSAQVHYNTRATTFVQDGDGRVIGVDAICKTKKLRYEAKQGVILATGGFGANVDMRMQYDSRWHKLNEEIPTTNSPAATGDGIIMAQEIGANLIDMGEIQLYPVNNPATGNYYFLDYARLTDNALLVNKQGERFVDEKETRENLSAALMKQKDATAYELIDSVVAERMNLELIYASEIERCMDQGVLVKGTLEECCRYFDIPLDAMKATIENYNAMAANGVDEDFHRTQDLMPILDGPYLMFSCVISVHHTMGGVQIDKDAQVINTDGNVIPGLFAAGEVTGGIHGENRLGSLSMPDTVAFGRIAARSAAAVALE